MTTTQAAEQTAFEAWAQDSAIRVDLGAKEAWFGRAAKDESLALRALLQSIVEDGFLSDTNAHRARMALAHPGRPLAEYRDSILEEAALACDVIASDRYDQYKGRGKYEPHNPQRADTYTNGESDGASECANQIRALQSTNQ